MRINVYDDTKVYVIAPARTATGGPELLHQLVYHLRKDLHIDAYVYYIPKDHPNPIHPEYEHYQVPFVRKIEDNNRNIIISPEIMYGLKEMKKYSKIRKAIWWLSVDNFYIYIATNRIYKLIILKLLNKVSKKFLKKEILNIKDLAYSFVKNLDKKLIFQYIGDTDYHLAQSFYAYTHLKKELNLDNVFYLSDYLNEYFLKEKVSPQKKENIVVYNPKKGYQFTKKIIEYAKKKNIDITFIPIKGLTREEVISLLKKAKVYIDFGNHPGKDRIPREAAILGCCVITGKKGSAKYFEDIPIPDKYKIEDKMENIPIIVERIKDIFENFEERYNDFNFYRKKIKKEPEEFLKDLKRIFFKV